MALTLLDKDLIRQYIIEVCKRYFTPSQEPLPYYEENLPGSEDQNVYPNVYPTRGLYGGFTDSSDSSGKIYVEGWSSIWFRRKAYINDGLDHKDKHYPFYLSAGQIFALIGQYQVAGDQSYRYGSEGDRGVVLPASDPQIEEAARKIEEAARKIRRHF